MKAAVLRGFNEPLKLEDVALQDPQAHEVLVKIVATGICHSDLSVIEGKFLPMLPVVLGHEAAGIVESVGSGVTQVAKGDHVILSFIPACGFCGYCSTGRPQLCQEGMQRVMMGAMADGTSRLSTKGESVFHFLGLSSFAEYAVVHEAAAIKIPDDMPLDKACLIGCGVMTGVGAAINTAGVKPATTVAVIGCGGVGLNAIQGSALAGARTIVAVDVLDNKLEMARRFGATHTVNAKKENALDRIQAYTEGLGADYSFEVIGHPDTVALAFDALRPGGLCVVVGVAPLDAQFIVTPMALMQEKAMKGCIYGSARPRVDMPHFIELYRSGRLKLDELISRTYKLEQINEAFDALREGTVARSVIQLAA